MKNFHTPLITFLKGIELDPTKKDYLKNSRAAIRDRIRESFKGQNLKQPTFCGQGSYLMKTLVKKIEEDYDIDDGVYLQHLDENREKWPSAETVHALIYEAVKSHTSETPTDKNACVRVQYKKDYHVDLPIYGTENGKYYLARKGADQWEENNSKDFHDWFTNKLDQNGEQFRNLIKYLKAWEDYHSLGISGFIITILVGNHFSKRDDRDDESLYYTVLNIASFLNSTTKVMRPVLPEKNVIAKWSESKLKNIREKFMDLKDRLWEANQETNEEKANKILQKIFGDRWPVSTPKVIPVEKKEVKQVQPWGI